jgi:hypothetical protein
MAGGLVQVISYGNQDIMLTGNPEITFFNIVYRRYTNFGKRVIELSFDNSVNFGETSILTIPKNSGDLLSRLTLKIKLPQLNLNNLNLELLSNDINKEFTQILENNGTYILYYDFYITFYNNLLNIVNIFFNKIDRQYTITYITDLNIFIKTYINDYKYQQFYTSIDYFYNNGLLSSDNKINIDIFKNASLFKNENNNLIYIYEQFNESEISYDEFKFTIDKNMGILSELNNIIYNKLKNLLKPNNSIQISWINKIGIYLFNSIDLYIGSNKISSLSDYYINNYGDLFYKNPELYNKIIGNKQYINLFTLKKDEEYLYLPIPFWFNGNYGLSFPLIALQFNTIQIRINLKKFIDCIKIYINPTLKSTNLQNKIIQNLQTNNNKSIIETDLEVTMLAEYIYLDNIERKKFAQSSHEYLITQVQEMEFNDLTNNNNSFSLDYFHCCKDIYWLAVKERSIEDIFSNIDSYIYSYSNSLPQTLTDVQKNYIKYINLIADSNSYFKPDDFITGRALFNNKLLIQSYNNLLITDFITNITTILKSTSIKIITESSLHYNGTQLIKDVSNFFNYVNPYKYYNSSPEIGLNVYSFCLNPTETQPSGSVNLSRIPNFSIKVNIDQNVTTYIDNNNDIKYKLIVQVTNYNVLRLIGGIGATAYTY